MNSSQTSYAGVVLTIILLDRWSKQNSERLRTPGVDQQLFREGKRSARWPIRFWFVTISTVGNQRTQTTGFTHDLLGELIMDKAEQRPSSSRVLLY